MARAADLQMLRHIYELYLESRELAFAPSPAILPSLRVASADDHSAGAACRICFAADFGCDPGVDAVATALGTGNLRASELVAPCSCIGSQEWVHVGCLQRWQRTCSGAQAARFLPARAPATSAGTARARVCNVCLSPFALAQPVTETRELDFEPPTLLVASPGMFSRGGFENAVVLVCYMDERSVLGVIVNQRFESEPASSGPFADAPWGRGGPLLAPLPIGEGPSFQPPDPQLVAHVRAHGHRARRGVVTWQRGGPVGGGRFAVVHFTVLHTALGHADSRVVMQAVAARSPPVSILCERLRNSPAAVDKTELLQAVGQLLVAGADPPPSSEPQILIFKGCSRWSRLQLASELAAGKWGVVRNPALADLFEPRCARSMWEDDVRLAGQAVLRTDA